ncbi:MAG: hypothetical protein ACFFF9_09010 [Candidatus Thorarchaeota archaeon]
MCSRNLDDYPERKYTVAWLLLHAVVFLIVGVIGYIYVVTQPRTPFSGVRFEPLIYLTLGLIGLWLSYAHYTITVKKKWLERWASFHVALSLYMFAQSTQHVTFVSTSFSPTPSLLILILLIVLPILVIVFLRKESP